MEFWILHRLEEFSSFERVRVYFGKRLIACNELRCNRMAVILIYVSSILLSSGDHPQSANTLSTCWLQFCLRKNLFRLFQNKLFECRKHRSLFNRPNRCRANKITPSSKGHLNCLTGCPPNANHFHCSSSACYHEIKSFNRFVGGNAFN